MSLFDQLQKLIDQLLMDERLSANLIAIGLVLSVIVLVWLLLQRLLVSLEARDARSTGWKWLDLTLQFAFRQLQSLLGWLTVAAVFGTIISGIGYHFTGGDIQLDLLNIYKRTSVEQMLHIGARAIALCVLVILAKIVLGALHRGRGIVEKYVAVWVGREPGEGIVPLWFSLLERYATAALLLGLIALFGLMLGVERFTQPLVEFLLRVVSIVVIARLLTLAFTALSDPLIALGNRHLAESLFTHYWERLARLVPFAQRCFEWAVYVSAASLIVRELSFVAFVAAYGANAVKCIGIFFGARVLIELTSVLLNEAFGLYSDQPRTGQHGRTLVPLLQSTCQYLIYIGAGIMMVETFGQRTTPILAAMGVVGLAAGLGAQSLVNDVVSGFFILFEGQYLVGDIVEIGNARGVVEAVAVRHTRIRDESGKLYIIPNGTVKEVVNYSKGFINAIVDLKVPSGCDLEAIMKAMVEAGKKLRPGHPEVLADTVVQGVIDLNMVEMTVRAVTRVRPGAQQAIQNQYRQILRSLLDPALLTAPKSRAA